jgi:hypothetical protein
MSWFEELLGFREENPDQVRSNLVLEGAILRSRPNGKAYRCGTLETPSLGELRERTAAMRVGRGLMAVEEVVADVQQLHQSPGCDGALFQVASQFNLLEMVGPRVTPEYGVGIYENDRTQGPACAIACGAATVMRNYFADVGGGQVGQSAERQIDCLHDLGAALGNSDGSLWEMQNGYALASAEGLEIVSAIIARSGEAGVDTLRSKLRIGVQWEAAVTLGGGANIVTQAFCSAVPVAYSQASADLWEPLARLILEASYEATFHAALLNRDRTGSSQLFLTLLGGGAFGNRFEWIIDSIGRSLALMGESGLDVKIVSYSGSVPEVRELLAGR